jgi:hypothetical protein
MSSPEAPDGLLPRMAEPGDGLGWRLDGDRAVGDEFRLVQFTPPHSPCSIHFGTGLTAAAPRAADRLARESGRTPDEAAAAAGRYVAEVKHTVVASA